MGNFIGLLSSIKTVLKCLWIYLIGLYVTFLAFIEPKMLSINSILYFLFFAKLHGPAGYYNISKKKFNLVASIQNIMLLLF